MKDMVDGDQATTTVNVSFLEERQRTTTRRQFSWRKPFFVTVRETTPFTPKEQVARPDWGLSFKKKTLVPVQQEGVIQLYPNFWGLVCKYDHDGLDTEIMVVANWPSASAATLPGDLHELFITNMELAGWENVTTGVLLGH